ncbi:MAG TPA: HEPN domain-containing protein [Spirochaetota bacterium]|nr:HEPN domain-containing protein [Spirochaetota bacterium]HPI91373.1 HEPN domain-containing protein [Spirochaetota bacterium]HPR49229.1 HEPN domain-containing protein [Spirochaetota bacterium]
MSLEQDLINYRRAKARDTLKDARALYNAASYLSVVNRIYYSLFYEVTALLLSKKLSSAKRSGIRSLFNEHGDGKHGIRQILFFHV